jgi:hypothetical protein
VVWGYNSGTELSRATAGEFPKTLIRASVTLTNALTLLSEAGPRPHRSKQDETDGCPGGLAEPFADAPWAICVGLGRVPTSSRS